MDAWQMKMKRCLVVFETVDGNERLELEADPGNVVFFEFGPEPRKIEKAGDLFKFPDVRYGLKLEFSFSSGALRMISAGEGQSQEG